MKIKMKKNSLYDLSFPDSPDKWKNAKANFKETELEILGHPVMQPWEESYMKELADVATKNRGRILEIGFGMGLSANYIQRNKPLEHIIIEANDAVYQKLLDFSKSLEVKIKPINEFWENSVNTFEDEQFDAILFDPYPISLNQLENQRFEFYPHAYRLLKKGGVFTQYFGDPNITERFNKEVKAAGFSFWGGYSHPVNPPKDCKYYSLSSMFVPVIIK